MVFSFKIIKLIFCFILFQNSCLKGQNSPHYYWQYNLEKLMIDFGENWNDHSTIISNNFILRNHDGIAPDNVFNRLDTKVHLEKNIFMVQLIIFLNTPIKISIMLIFFQGLFQMLKKLKDIVA